MSARRQIIAALTEDSLGGIATLADVTRAEDLVDAYRAEILADAKAEVVAWLVKKACEGTEVSRLADKVQRGAIRLFLNVEEKATDEQSATATPDFFQPGHTYTKLRGTWLFRCDHISTHPDGGERTAFGWLRRNEKHSPWVESFKSETAWMHDGWTDVTEAGER